MFVKVLIMSESSPLIERHQLKGIEDRLGRVENTLSEILENGELMEERIKDKLGSLQEELERNTMQVKRMKLKIGQGMRPITVIIFILIGLMLWTWTFTWFRY
ncbi:MAG: hypothetical protein CMC93_05645 [Flavobacteriaceae bacterium]|nr:hypothetical protein [Flavobacteriaceae bacterium]|tara:strand:- start:1928 stop:2236 length:309 start_codon:yes stop_codon:yes gene_type:complete